MKKLKTYIGPEGYNMLEEAIGNEIHRLMNETNGIVWTPTGGISSCCKYTIMEGISILSDKIRPTLYRCYKCKRFCKNA